MRTSRALARIDELAEINALLFVDRAASGRAGVIAVKDNIDVRGMPTTAGGRHLSSEPRRRDAECVSRLRAAGWAIVGKTNLYEYAMGATSRNEHWGDVRNPRDLARDAGGSSSGSAAAVAAGMCDAALGTDTLGSVRIPAAFCGVVGYKPPRAAISRSGVFPNATSLDAVGVLAPDVATASRVAGVVRRTPLARRRRSGPPRLGVPWAWMDGIADEVRRAFMAVADGLPDVALPPLDAFGAAFGIVQYESYALHRRWWRSAPELYGSEVHGLLALSARARRPGYDAARRDAARLRREVRRALAAVDAVLIPTTPQVAPRRARYPLTLRRTLSRWTRPFNVSDTAVFSIPIPTAGPPVGLQIAANDEATAVAVASYLERRLAARTTA